MRHFVLFRQSTYRSLLALIIATAAIVVPIPFGGTASAAPASGTIEGTVFRDFGADGSFDSVDSGEAGIEVRVYDDENAMAGPVLSDEDGAYSVDLSSLEQTVTDTYRVEFTIPTTHNYLQNSFLGDDNKGPVQFVAANTSDAHFGVTNPAQFCEANPTLAVTCWVNGQADGDSDDGPNDSDTLDALVTLPWDGHSSTTDLNLPTNPSHVAYNGQIGTTWGVAHQRTTDSLYIGAAQRRHAGFGPGGTGMIYKVNTDGSSFSNFLDLNALAGIATGADPHTGLPDQSWVQSNPADSASYDSASFDAVGKISLGDIDISENGETLWAVNVNDRTLLEIPIGPTGVAPTAAEITQHDLGGAVSCTNGEFRPFGLGVRDGKVYAGGVCSGENGGSAADVVSHVLSHDPNGADSNFTSVYSLPMDYRATLRPANEECAFRLGGSGIGCDGWGPWASSWGSPEELILSANHRFYAAPQPILTDIELDADGSIVLAFADRFGMQSGFRNYDDSGTNTALHSGTTGGDLIRICNDEGSLTFPCRADNSEFYVGDNAPGGSDLHPESGWGGIAMHFANGEVAMTIADPIRVWSGGIGWFDKETGLIPVNPDGTTRRYEVFEGGSDNLAAPPSGQTGVGKAAGLGDLELICEAAPFQIGDRTWFDRNANGRQDPSEPSLPGVTVLLRDSGGDVIAQTTTDASGIYNFSSLEIAELTTLSDYTLEFDASTAELIGIEEIADVSLLKATTQNAADTDDNDDSDIDPATNRIAITTGSSGVSNFSFDAGFTGGLQIGNMVWFDLNNNGDADDGEPLVEGIELQLYRENGAAGFDGTEELVTTTTTDENGVYSFKQIIEGDAYYVAIAEDQAGSTIVVDGQTLDGSTLMTSFSNGSGGADNAHDGQPTDGFLSVTEAITLSDDVGSEPTDETDTPPSPDTDAEAALFATTDHFIEDDNSNLTVDFGIVQKLRIGNLVWLDGEFGDAGFNNGIADAAEANLGLGEVTVELYEDDGDEAFSPDMDELIDTVTTDSSGRYWFEAVNAGNYFAAIPADQTGQTLDGNSVDLDTLFRSTPISDSADGEDDRNDGSAGSGFASVSSLFTADAAIAPTSEGGDFGSGNAEAEANAETGGYVNSFSDLTIDFSFVEQPVFSIGNLVWADLDNDGIAEDGEPGIEGVTVELHVAGETDVYDSVETDENGKYVFENLPAGDYEVSIDKNQTGQQIGEQAIDLSALLASSAVATNTNDDTDNDHNGIGTTTLRTSAVSVGDPDPYNPSESESETLRSDDTTDDDASVEDASSNLTVDFGFVLPARIGNLVWLDNGGGNPGDYTYNEADENDGEADVTEAGIAGVLVQLLDDSDEVVFETVTDEQGRYWFPAVLAANYKVAIPAEQIPVLDLTLAPTLGALDNVEISSVVSTNPETADDDNDGAAATGFAALSETVTVGYGTEPTDENGDFDDATVDAAEDDANTANGWLPDGNSNLAVDFGFVPVPTYSVGNLLWEDYDNDGIADDGEPGIAGVLVFLVDNNGEVIAELLTDEDGNYRFDDVAAGDYTIVIPENQAPVLDVTLVPTPQALAGLKPSSVSVADPDDATSIDHDSNGVAVTEAVVSGTFTLGDGDTHSEPTGETVRSDDAASIEPAATRADRTELTVDFGFWRGLRLGNQVWLDGIQGEAGYDNGVMDAGEPGLAGVRVELWRDVDGDSVAEPEGDDSLSALDVTVTDTEGNYWFTGLEDGEPYFVVIRDADGLETNQEFSSTGISGTPLSTDNDDDGAPLDGHAAVSEVVTLTTGDQSTGETDAVPAEDAEAEANAASGVTPDANSELLVDFGFIEVPRYRVGNIVWDDTNANGLAEEGEPGIAGVLVQLFAGPTLIGETVTAADGSYLFVDLVAGDYNVVIPLSQTPQLGEQTDLVAGALDGFRSSSENESDDPNDDVDNDDNGVGNTLEAASSEIVTLGPDGSGPSFETEPTDETQRNDSAVDSDPNAGEEGSYPDSMSNLSVDFGFYRLTLGNQVWFDTDADGTKDEGEPGINGVEVNLLLVDGEDETVVATTETANDGEDGMFIFTGLIDGETYIVEIAASEFAADGPLAGMFSSPDSDPVADVTVGIDNDDNGIDPEADEPLRSDAVEVSAGEAPTGEDPAGTTPGADDTQNVTVDFGVVGLALGDQVWLDENENGVIDEGEPGIEGVTVELWATDETGTPTGTEPLTTVTTDEEGNFLFAGLTPGSFIVVLPEQNFATDGPLVGFTSTLGNGVIAPLPSDDVDNDDNGNLDESGLSIASGVIELSFAGEPGDETGEDPQGFDPRNTNLSVDFGLVPTPPMSVGNRVWEDTNNNGVIDEGEPGIEGVTVELWTTDETGTPTGTEPLTTVTTDETGHYLFEGVTPGTFVIVLPASNFVVDGPAHGLFSSTSSPATDPNDDVDSNDDGIDPAGIGSAITSSPFTLVPSWEPLAETDTGLLGAGSVDGTPIADAHSNLSVDFGLVQVGVGNRVWFDADNSGTFDEGETPFAGVEIALVDSDGQLVTTTMTDDDGYYLFIGFTPGDYRVVVTAENFAAGGPLAGHFSSTGNGVATDPDDDVDLDDDGEAVEGGSIFFGSVWSDLVTIEAGSEPTGETGLTSGTDANVNATVDFGFYTADLLTTLWIDANDDGTFDKGETPLANVNVEVVAAEPPNTVLGKGTTDQEGQLFIEGLPEGSVKLHFTPENFEDGGPLDDVVLRTTSMTEEGGMLSETIELVSGSNEVELLDVLGTTLVPESTIGDTVWNDKNGDGIKDDDEPGLADIVVTLLDEAGNEIDQTTTDENGNYNFDGLLSEVYTVVITVPEGWELSPQDVGDNDSVDSDFNPSTSSTTITLDTGDRQQSIDAGLRTSDFDSLGAPPDDLAFTGSSVMWFGFAGLVLSSAGVAIYAMRRRQVTV